MFQIFIFCIFALTMPKNIINSHSNLIRIDRHNSTKCAIFIISFNFTNKKFARWGTVSKTYKAYVPHAQETVVDNLLTKIGS